ncbi:hypothetical protein Acid345_3592 [Candidatus Koribacter versatilis Ellin345]|uniref:Fibronectin type-III domain-containing protein n=1 Tax=Koribacter versatilis (strain Ellin345) TaxID=204669 RepID=Q1IKK7_KORVE|nr:fibronectin type III domain-containing protein [Candidatus Koribacter versatilis]ABF42593.1 hypothetical protein Acid345_3592 [Candidatus Koribacter versatilis Ellin345]
MTFRSRLLLFLGCGLFVFTLACGNDHHSNTPVQNVTIAIAPDAQQMWVNGSQQFSVSVSGTTNTAVNWGVSESGGGTIDDTGKYTAPGTAGTYHVTAISKADTTRVAKAAVIVSVPAPAFNSTPTTAAAEGTAYSYTLDVSDPAGSDVTLALTTAPDGATLNGKTVTWTPSAQQARQQNAFIVTATTAAGGTNTQSWAVAPTGTIHGKIQISHWSSDGTVDIESNSVAPPFWTFAALVPQADGSLTVLPGNGYADATFDIPNVPAGYYWLQFQPGDVMWTNASYMDYGSDAMGRKQKQVIPQYFGCDLTGLDPWNPGLQSLDFYSINSQAFAVPLSEPWSDVPAFGDTTCDITNTLFPMGLNVITNDVSTAAQFEQLPSALTFFRAEGMGPALNQVIDMEIPLATTVVGGALTRQTSDTQDINVKFSDWKSAFDSGGPSTAQPVAAQIYAESRQKADALTRENPILYGFYPILAGAVADGSSPWPPDGAGDATWPADGDFGSIPYNNPFADSNTIVYTANIAAQYQIPFPGSTAPAYATVQWYMQSPTMANPLVPLLKPISSAQIDGKDLLAQETVSTASPTLTWTAPASDNPVIYTIDICEPYQNPDSSTGCGFVYEFNHLTGTSFTVPAGILTPGHNYIFVVLSTSRAGYDPLHPNRYSLPEANAYFLSAAITVDGGAPAGVVRGDKKLLKVREADRERLGKNLPIFSRAKFQAPAQHFNSRLLSLPGQQEPKPTGVPYKP